MIPFDVGSGILFRHVFVSLMVHINFDNDNVAVNDAEDTDNPDNDAYINTLSSEIYL